ncbi:hypothetical protein [Streptomyces arboris]|uniref:hypothetical protein n=1 Tax=Streptomyces arboris TaxID=2600619 RepID=UPI00363E84F6
MDDDRQGMPGRGVGAGPGDRVVLGVEAGITTDYLPKIEKGLKKPSGEVLALLAASPPSSR